MFIIYRLSFSKIKRIILSFVLILFLILYFFISSFSSQEEDIQKIISEGRLVKEKVFGDYTYRHYIGPPYDFEVFQIFKKDQLVYQSDIGYAYWLYRDNEIYTNGEDITGDGIPNLLVEYASGGSSGGNACFIFSLGQDFRLIQALPQGEFLDLNQDGILDYRTHDCTFTNWHACNACSPRPSLLYQFSDGNYQLSPDLMSQELPTEEELKEMRETVYTDSRICEQEFIEEHNLSTINASCWTNGDVFIPPSAWGYMLDLIYSGHPKEAFAFLDSIWPENKIGKNVFLHDFLQQLKYTDFYEQAIAHVDYRITASEEVYTTAWQAYTNHDFPEAISIFQEFLSIKPDYEAAIFHLGWSYLQTRNQDEAEVLFQKTIALNEKYRYIYYHIGKRFINEKEYEKAIEAFNRIINTEYADDRVYYRLGYSYYNVERYQEAIEAYKKAAEQLEPSDLKASIYVNIALCSYEIERYDQDQARDYLYRSVEMDPDNDYAHYLLGFILYVKYQDTEGAQKELEILQELESPYARKLKSLL